MDKEELFEVVDENNRTIGLATRSECHGNPEFIHKTAHVVVYGPEGKILLQKRSDSKDIQPGKWDTAVGGHLVPGESFEDAARRETLEELGVSPPENIEFKFLFDLRIRNRIESENVKVFSLVHGGPFDFDRDEIDELKFWSINELSNFRQRNDFTPNLKRELLMLLENDKNALVNEDPLNKS